MHADDLLQAALERRGALDARPWRSIEAQHVVATRKLVDSERDHELLEALIEAHKPPPRNAPPPESADGTPPLHYLLATPFRYPPLRYGSRFGTRHEAGIWYGAETPEACFAEVAYYRLVFLEGTTADLGAVSVELSVFRARLATDAGVDLTAPALRDLSDYGDIASPTSYTTSQALGRNLREHDIEAARYPSARLEGGVNYAVFSPTAFAEPRPSAPQTWHCVATRDAVELTRKSYFERGTYRFVRDAFLIDGALPAPSV